MCPFKEHPATEEPQDEVVVWKYMDLAKLIFLLETQSLFFTKAKIFREKFDKYEGTYPDHIIDSLLSQAKNDDERRIILRNHNYQKRVEPILGIHCWHINDHESAAMWKIYSSRGYGIALQSTFGNIKKSLENTEIDVYGGKVIYIDYDRESIPWGNLFHPYIHKRKIFEYENELRLFVMKIPILNEQGFSPAIEIENDGMPIPIKVDLLVEKICLSPGTPIWVRNLIEMILKRYALNINVKLSDLDRTPVYDL